MTCDATINLSRPIRSEKVRSFQPPWRTVYIYKCEKCNQERRVYANSFVGLRRTPSGGLAPIRSVPSVGAIVCGAYIGQLDTVQKNGSEVV